MITHTYHYVVTLAKHANLTSAAKELCITQPALTKFINRLENELGLPLFDRSVSPIRLTYAGERYLEKARIILGIEKELERELHMLTTAVAGKLSFGITSEMGSIILPYLVPEFRFRFPNIELQITEGSNDFLTKELLNNQIDLAMISNVEYHPSLADFSVLAEDNVILAVPLSHPLARSFDLSDNSPTTPYYLSPEQIAGEGFLAASEDTGIGKTTRQIFNRYQLRPKIIFRAHKNETVLRLASSGMGMAFTLVRTPLRVKLVNPMAYFSIEDPIRARQWVIKYRASEPVPEITANFAALVKELFAEIPALQVPACRLLYK